VTAAEDEQQWEKWERREPVHRGRDREYEKDEYERR
jgi:hypothetical protein